MQAFPRTSLVQLRLITKRIFKCIQANLSYIHVFEYSYYFKNKQKTEPDLTTHTCTNVYIYIMFANRIGDGAYAIRQACNIGYATCMKYLYTFCFFIKRKTIKTKKQKTKQNGNKNHSIICLQIQFVIDFMYYEKMSTKFTTCYKDFV